jgi:hypothetical protein
MRNFACHISNIRIARQKSIDIGSRGPEMKTVLAKARSCYLPEVENETEKSFF